MPVNSNDEGSWSYFSTPIELKLERSAEKNLEPQLDLVSSVAIYNLATLYQSCSSPGSSIRANKLFLYCEKILDNYLANASELGQDVSSAEDLMILAENNAASISLSPDTYNKLRNRISSYRLSVPTSLLNEIMLNILGMNFYRHAPAA